MKLQTYRLKNGIRLVHKSTDSSVAYCGVFIKAGARNEKTDNWGVAHFAEHMIFKGTEKRKSYQIINDLEQEGGELNAYTTKEETCIHAGFLKEDYERVIELMSDIILHSTFPKHEISKERDVIVDEINSYKDNPSERIFDEFDEEIFGNNQLGRNILGSSKSVANIDQKILRAFIRMNYHPERIVISSVGSYDFKKLCQIVSRYFEDFAPISTKEKSETIAINYQPSSRCVELDSHQTHCIIGNIAYGRKNNSKYALSLLNNMLGGPAMSSILNMVLREKYGYAYHTETNYNVYEETGIFSIYFATESENYEACRSLVKKELDKICTKQLGATQLCRYKKQFKGQTLIANDHNENVMFNLGKQLLFYDCIRTVEDWYREIDKLTPSSLIETANQVLDSKQFSELIYR